MVDDLYKISGGLKKISFWWVRAHFLVVAQGPVDYINFDYVSGSKLNTRW